jgi:dolichol-phosphate mannosyltransferase
MKPLISIVSPVYGCRDCLEALTEAVGTAFDGRMIEWELVLVDDRAPDHPWSLIEDLAKANPRVRGIRLARNHGQHLAIWAGLEAAKGEWVAVIDCDLQDDPAIIPELYDQISGSDLHAVVVKRGDWSDTWLRRAGSRQFYKMIKSLAGFDLENVGNFGLYSRRMVDTLLEFKEQEVFLPLMVSVTGLQTGHFELNRSERYQGASSYSFFRLLRLAGAIIIRFSDRPLKLSVLVGVIFSGISALISVILLAMWLTGIAQLPGWTSAMLSAWFLSGLILAVLGVHGMYMGRIFDEVKRRPRLIVEKSTDRPRTVPSEHHPERA